jgi:hypothetical protein
MKPNPLAKEIEAAINQQDHGQPLSPKRPRTPGEPLTLEDLEHVSGGWADPISAFADALSGGLPADAGQSLTGPSSSAQGLMDILYTGYTGGYSGGWGGSGDEGDDEEIGI